MSTQICRLLVLARRSSCCHSSGPYLQQAVLAPVCSSGLCVPGAPMPLRRAYSLDSLSLRPTPGPNSKQHQKEKTSPHRRLSAVSAVAVQGQQRPLGRYDFLDIEEVEGQVQASGIIRHLVDPRLARLLTQHLGPDLENAKAAIFDCNPGPGLLTRTLLNAGAQRVVALEGYKPFLNGLQELEARLDGQLQVVHGDYFRLDPMGSGQIRSPSMLSEKLFTDLGISEASWTDDVPVKVVGILPFKNARCLLFRMVYNLLERLSVYRYGRMELNLFISEKEYRSMACPPGDYLNYRAYSVLWRIACDIELLHMEPWESFAMSRKQVLPRSKSNAAQTTFPNDHLCLVRLRPRADLFSSGLTPSNAATLIVMVKQCMAKRKTKLSDKLNLWIPDSGSKLLSELGLPEDIWTGDVHPEEYRGLFELMEKSQDFKQSWLYMENMENVLQQAWP